MALKPMRAWIVLLRGVNVGGANKLPMKELIEVLEDAGCSDVRTYIQSGNLVLRSSLATREAVAACVVRAVRKARGFEPRVLVLRPRELVQAAAANPFPAAARAPQYVHLFFLRSAPEAPDLDTQQALQANGEAFALRGKVLYLYTPHGFGTSKLAGRIEKAIGVEGTARNWRTVAALLELAAAT
jgi:uncharacterized protein (DUF1697 family)